MADEAAIQPADERAGLPSASKFERLAACPGSRNMEASVPDVVKKAIEEEKDELRDSGTRVHRARELGNTMELDEEEVKLYEQGLKCEQEQVEKWQKTRALPAYTEGPREERLWLHDRTTLAPILSAKLDVHYLSGEYALVLDWKRGFCTSLVGSTGNWQLRVQALLLKQEHPELKLIRVGFVKPMFKALDFTDYNEQDLQYCYDSILLTLWWSTQPDAQRVPGRQCLYCPAKAYCPEAGAYSMLPTVIAKRVQNSNLMPWPMMVDAMSPEDLYKVWEMSSIVDKITESVKKRLKGMPKEQLALLGLELPEKGAKNDSFFNVPGAFSRLSQTFLADDILAAMNFQKANLTDLVMRDKGLSKETAEQWWDSHLDEFIKRDFKEPSLRRAK